MILCKIMGLGAIIRIEAGPVASIHLKKPAHFEQIDGRSFYKITVTQEAIKIRWMIVFGGKYKLPTPFTFLTAA